MKYLILTIFIAATAALAVPRDLHTVGEALLRFGVIIIRAGLVLYPRGYDAGEEPRQKFTPADRFARSPVSTRFA